MNQCKEGFVKIFFLAFLIGSTISIQAATKEEVYNNFRDAFLKKDFSKLKTLSKFPIDVKGELDSDPTYKVTEKKFIECFSLIYKKEVGIVEVAISHEDYLRDHPDIKILAKNPNLGINLKTKDSFRIADFEFSAKEFKLDRFYLDTNSLDVKKACLH
jgi:hypothetical protein